MKLFSTAIALLSATRAIAVDNPCTICPDGITVSADVCEEVKDIKSTYAIYEADSEFCPKSTYEAMCCPTLENPCQFCPGGIDLEESPMANSTSEEELAEMVSSCGDYDEAAKRYEADSEECSVYRQGEASCCPGQSSASTLLTSNMVMSTMPGLFFVLVGFLLA